MGWVFAALTGTFGDVASALVALGAGVVVPLGLIATCAHRQAQPAVARSFDVVSLSASLAAPFAVASFLIPRGQAAGALATVWLAATLLVAGSAAARALRRGAAPLEELAIDVGHLYLPVGAAWLVAARAGLEPMGFREPVVTFTANHFHYAGFAAPVVIGLVGRELGGSRAARADEAAPLAGQGLGRLYRVTTPIVLAGIPLVAAGITLSQSLEKPAAFLLGAGMLGAATCIATVGARRLFARGLGSRLTGFGLLLAGGSLVVSMGFAVAFAATGSAGRGAAEPVVSFSTMVALHGAANALGFGLLASLALALQPPAPRVRVPEIPWPRVFARGFVGPDFFERSGLVDPAREVRGQVSSLAALGHAGFDASTVHDDVRRFYERTADYVLYADPTWRTPFVAAGRLHARVMARLVGQLVLPTTRDEGPVHTELFGLRAERDERKEPIGYVRCVDVGGERRASFVASYARIEVEGQPYLSCAFPLPRCALVAVLCLEAGAVDGGLALTSASPRGDGSSAAGMYLVTPLGALRLPLSERLEVWRDEGGALRATHVARLVGLTCFTIAYAIEPREPAGR